MTVYLALVFLASTVWSDSSSEKNSTGPDDKRTQDNVEFNRDVRPILSDRCFACHGPDEQSREADLRLDDRASATSEEIAAIVVGDAAQSELIRRVESKDGSEVMPPPEHGEPLTKPEIAILKRWIKQGANYERHWSLKAIERPQVPTFDDEFSNPIDAFIQRRLSKEGIESAPQTDPRTLVRRLAFDLKGLPPEETQVSEFAANPSDSNYEQIVDQYLSSPHYGERLAMYWLDLVRYADTLGYHGDQQRSVSPYRDYVIQAFNENKPFDQFTIEQLAGDLLPDATLWQKVASTYNRLNRASGEGGVQPKEYLAKYSADRVRTTGAVWLGMTIGCAECHDHKFDPFTIRDFYSFAAFFADIKEQGIVRSAVHIEKLPVPTTQQQKQLSKLDDDIKNASQRYDSKAEKLDTAQRDWEETLARDIEKWKVLTPSEAKSNGEATLSVLDDQSILVSGKNPDRDVYTLTGDLELSVSSEKSDAISIRLELMPDKKLPRNGPGRASNGNLVLNDLELEIDGQLVNWSEAVATHSQVNHSPKNVINGNKNGWAILPAIGKPVEIVLSGKLPEAQGNKPLVKEGSHPSGSKYVLRLHQNHGNGHNLGRFRVSFSTSAEVGLSTSVTSAAVRKLAAIPPDQRNAQQLQQLTDAFRSVTPMLEEERKTLERLRGEKSKLEKSLVTTLATTATEPRPIRVLPRGNWMDDSGEIVSPAVPGFLPTLTSSDGARLSRLDLARWMTTSENPLVARTFVNRLWMLMFGNGLAPNVDDLGSQGEPPTHPELLDWLAAEFVESGWDVKHMVRLIVNSKTYKQSSRGTPELIEHDPYNRLYARQSRWRLEAEMVRDNALAVSGLLNLQIGGVSAMPYQPAGYWAQLNFPKRKYQADRGPEQYRRGLYTHWQRTFLHPSLLAFDAPPREECTARRSRSNTPLQSLVLLNDPTFVEAARKLAETMLVELVADQDGSSVFEDRLKWLVRKTLMREPRQEEIRLLGELFANDFEVFASSPDAAQQLLSIGEAGVPDSVNAAELAAWTNVSRAILNLHESITRY